MSTKWIQGAIWHPNSIEITKWFAKGIPDPDEIDNNRSAVSLDFFYKYFL